MPGGEIAIGASLHLSLRWITIPITVAGGETLSMVLDTGSPVSAISPEAVTRLLELRLTREGSQPRSYILEQITSGGQPLPDLEVRVLARLDRLGIVGLVGLDFLMRFRRIHFDVDTFQLVLEDR
jgi:hypothetical protein